MSSKIHREKYLEIRTEEGQTSGSETGEKECGGRGRGTEDLENRNVVEKSERKKRLKEKNPRGDNPD